MERGGLDGGRWGLHVTGHNLMRVNIACEGHGVTFAIPQMGIYLLTCSRLSCDLLALYDRCYPISTWALLLLQNVFRVKDRY